MSENDKFCANCGARIVRDDEAVAISKENKTDDTPAEKKQAAVLAGIRIRLSAENLRRAVPDRV